MALESTELLPIAGQLFANEGTNPELPVAYGSLSSDPTRYGIDDILGDITTLGIYRARARRHFVVEGDGNELACSIVGTQVQVATGSCCLDGRIHRNTGAYNVVGSIATPGTYYVTVKQTAVAGVYSASFVLTHSSSWTDPADELLLCTVDSDGSALSNLVDRRWYFMVGNGRAADLLHVEGRARVEGDLRLGAGTDTTQYIYCYNADSNKPGLRYNASTNAWEFSNDGSSWTAFGGGTGTSISDADADTKIQTEESADEDVLRFDAAGTEIGRGDTTDWQLKRDILRVGAGADTTIAIYAQNADADKPGLRYNSSTNQWELSNNGTTWNPIGASTGMTSFTVAGDSGIDQTIENGDTLAVAGGTGIATVAGATDTVTIHLDAGLDDLSDVTITSPAQGQILHRGASGWVNLAVGTAGQVLKSGGAGADVAWGGLSLGDLLDVVITSGARGDIYYNNGSNIVNLAPGTSGHFLKTQGAGADPVWAAAPGGSLALDDLTDVTVSTAARGDILFRNATTWINMPAGTAGQLLKTGGAGADPSWSSIAVDDLSDVALTTPAQGAVLYFNGTQWVNLAAGTNGQFLKTQGVGANPVWDTPSAGALDDLSDVTITSPATGALLFYDGSAWIDGLPAAAGVVAEPSDTAQGDLLYYTGPSVVGRLPKGAAYQVLRMQSDAANVEWGNQLGSFTWVIQSPAVGTVLGPLDLASKIVVDEITFGAVGGTSVAFNVENRTTFGSSGADLNSTELTATAGSAGADSSLQNATIAAGSGLALDISAVTGSVTQLVVTVNWHWSY